MVQHIKVNYNNGAVTVCGPSSKIASTAAIQNYPLHPIPTQNLRQTISYPFPHPVINSQQIGIKQIPIPNQLKYCPSFSASTASQSIPAELDGKKIYKTNSEIFNSIPFTPQPQPQPQPQNKNQFEKYKEQIKNQLQTPNFMKIQTYKQQQIDCVICEKKFKTQEFQYHLQLHRNPRNNKKINPFQPISSSIQNKNHLSSQQELINNLNSSNHVPIQNKIHLQNNSLHIQSNPIINQQLLYSFHKNSSMHSQNNNPNINIQQNQSQNSSQIYKNNFQDISRQSILNNNNNSKVLSVRSIKEIQVDSSLNGSLIQPVPYIINSPINTSFRPQEVQIMQMNSGIRYLAQPNNKNILNNSILIKQSERISLCRQIQTQLPFKRQMSMNSSRISNSSSNQKQNIHSDSKNILGINPLVQNKQIIPNNIKSNQQPSNPFNLIEHQQSKIYQYFPDSGHYSLAQHRVNPQICPPRSINFHNSKPPSGLLKNHKSPQNQGLLRKIKSNDEYDVRSQISDSSISSVRSQNEPLQVMSRDNMIKNYHGNKARIDLSKIIGMSQVLARQGVTSNNSIRQQYSNLYDSNKQYRPNDQKVMIAKSMIANEDSQPLIYNEDQTQRRNMPQNLQMIAVQNRQVFRGTQVEQDDLRSFDSVLNITRSSKSSAKTKLPKNYLAINDFINSGSIKQGN